MDVICEAWHHKDSQHKLHIQEVRTEEFGVGPACGDIVHDHPESRGALLLWEGLGLMTELALFF